MQRKKTPARSMMDVKHTLFHINDHLTESPEKIPPTLSSSSSPAVIKGAF